MTDRERHLEKQVRELRKKLDILTQKYLEVSSELNEKKRSI